MAVSNNVPVQQRSIASTVTTNNSPAAASVAQQQLKALCSDQKGNWMDGDFAAAKQAATTLAESGQLSANKAGLDALFTRGANQRKGDYRLMELSDTIRSSLVDVVKDPKATPAEKAVARELYDAMRYSGMPWSWNASLDMPAANAGWQGR